MPLGSLLLLLLLHLLLLPVQPRRYSLLHCLWLNLNWRPCLPRHPPPQSAANNSGSRRRRGGEEERRRGGEEERRRGGEEERRRGGEEERRRGGEEERRRGGENQWRPPLHFNFRCCRKSLLPSRVMEWIIWTIAIGANASVQGDGRWKRLARHCSSSGYFEKAFSLEEGCFPGISLD